MKRLLCSLLATVAIAAPASAQILGTQYVTALSGGACNSGACASFSLPAQTPTLTFDISGTFTATLTFEQTVDGVNWRTATVIKTTDLSSATTATAAGSYAFSNQGFQGVRVRATAFTSGTAVITAAKGYAGNAQWLSSTPTFTVLYVAPTADCSAPGYSFTGRTDTGVTSVAASSVSQCAGATEVTRATTTFFKSFLPVYHPDGAVGAPVIAPTSDPTLGIWFASNTLRVSVAGAETIRLGADVWTDTAGGLFRLGSSGDVNLGWLAAGQLKITKDSTHGVAFDVGTDGTANCLSRAGADTCILRASQGLFQTIVLGANKSTITANQNGLIDITNNAQSFGVELSAGTAAPTVGTCGTGAIKANSRNTAGGFTATGAAACTVTFGAGTFTNTPHVIIIPTKSPTTMPYVSAESTTSFTVSGLTAGDNLTVDFHVVGGV